MTVTVSKTFKFDAGHRLPDHPGKCRFLHGHTYDVVVEVVGDIGVDGMVIDFGDLKAIVEPVIAKFDHKFLVVDSDPLIGMLYEGNEDIVGSLVFMTRPPTAENIAQDIFRGIRGRLSTAKFSLKSVRVHEGGTSYAEVSNVVPSL